MTLQEAIKILERQIKGDSRCCHPERYDATQLGIEALKAITFWNHKQLPQYQIHLPGETKE